MHVFPGLESSLSIGCREDPTGPSGHPQNLRRAGGLRSRPAPMLSILVVGMARRAGVKPEQTLSAILFHGSSTMRRVRAVFLMHKDKYSSYAVLA